MQFVILEHQKQNEPIHWDLMLEQPHGLKTFRLETALQDLLTQPCRVTPIFDHARRFLSYEGPVQKGLGQVKRVETGLYETISQTEQYWTVNLYGSILHAQFKLPVQQEDTLIVTKI